MHIQYNESKLVNCHKRFTYLFNAYYCHVSCSESKMQQPHTLLPYLPDLFSFQLLGDVATLE